MAPDAVGEEGARAQVARDQLLHVRVPDLVQGGVVVRRASSLLLFCRKKEKNGKSQTFETLKGKNLTGMHVGLGCMHCSRRQSVTRHDTRAAELKRPRLQSDVELMLQKLGGRRTAPRSHDSHETGAKFRH